MEKRPLLKTTVQALRKLRTEIRECQISVYAGNAAFFLALSALPIATLLMGLMQHLPGEASSFLESSLQILPGESAAVIRYLFTVSDPITVASVSAIAALWTASRGIYGMMRGLNRAFCLRETRSWLRTRASCMGDTLLLIGALPILFCLAGKLRSLLSGDAVRISALFLTALLLYRSLPNHGQPFHHLLPGSIFSSVAWFVFSSAYEFYLHHISPGKLTGSLSNIAVTLLWMYFCMELFFLGAVLSRLFQKKIPQD